MGFRKFTRRERWVFGFCLFLACAYGLQHFFLKPLQEQTGRGGSAVQAQYKKLRSQIKMMEDLPAIRVVYNQYKKEYLQVGSDEQVLSSVIAEIEGVAGSLNLKISDLKPQRVRAEEFLNHFSVSLTLDSDFSEILEFLRVLQDQPHLFDVEDLRLDRGSRRGDQSLKVRLVLSKFFIRK